LAVLLPLGLPDSALGQQTLINDATSYTFAGQSIWDTGGAVQYSTGPQFVGIDSNPGAIVIGSGSGDTISVAGFSVNPYLQFDTDFKLGVEFGASIDSGSIDGNLDYGVSLTAPGQIQVGQAFSLTGSATALGSSSFATQSPTAEAYLDGILEAYVGGYARFEYNRPFPLSDQDLRWGNKGFTNGNTSNTPYATIANINERMEILGINRNQSGVIRYLGGTDLTDGDLLYDSLGKGSSVSLGPIEVTAGSIDVVTSGVFSNGRVVGSGQDTMASAVLDIDHLLLGSPALGLSLGHDYGDLAWSMGYDVVDFDAGLDIMLEQDFALDGTPLIDLVFSEAVLIGGVAGTQWTGEIDQIPMLTLLTSLVDVDATLLVDAVLTNQTGFGLTGSLDETFMQAGASLSWNILGNSGSKGYSVGPVWSASQSLGLGSLDVYDESFSIGQQSVGTWSFSLVPEPATSALLIMGLAGLHRFGRTGRRA
jgi:hypothetical protein